MKRSEIKQNIVETASLLFYKNGYNATGINEIISEAGIAKATLYNHFKSKEEICLAYLNYKNGIFLHDIKDFCQSRKKGKEQILGIFEFLNSFFKQNDFNGCWCIKTVAEIPFQNKIIRREIQNHKKQFMNFIADLVELNLGSKGDKENREGLSRKIYLLYESAVGESHLHQKKWPIDEAKELCSQIIN